MDRLNPDPVLVSADKLESSLTADVPGHEQEWTGRTQRALLDLEGALRSHKVAAEGKDGMFEALHDLGPEMLPTLDRNLQKLCSDHSEFLQQATDLKEDVQKALQAFQPPDERSSGTQSFGRTSAAKCVPDFGALRQRGLDLVGALRKHREVETKLVLETATIDVGVGD
jgi:hypothetical protein